MTQDKFQVTGGQLAGRGLSIDAASLVGEVKVAVGTRCTSLVEIAEVIYLQGRSSVLPSLDDRFDLHSAVEILRALAVVAGPNVAGDRHRRAADAVSRLLQQQGDG